MDTRTIRLALALTAFVVALQWSSVAAADVTITGTVGEIGIGSYYTLIFSNIYPLVRFKLTDANQTKTCTGGANSAVPPGFAIYKLSDPMAREWYSMLLLSKKGAPIACIMSDSPGCAVKDCALP